MMRASNNGHRMRRSAHTGDPTPGGSMQKKTFVAPTLKEEASLAEVTLFSGEIQ